MGRKRVDDMDREELIAHYMPIVRKQIKRFMTRKPSLLPHYEDLLGEGYLRLVEMVEKKISGKIESFPTYLRLTIIGACADYLRRDSLIPVRAKHPPVIIFKNVDLVPILPENRAEFKETVEAILAAVKDRKDAMIVQGRLEGSSLSAIAARVGLTQQTVRARLTRMERRYEQTSKTNV